MKLHSRGIFLAAMCGTAFTLATSPALAQQEDEQVWLQVNANVRVADGVRLTLEQIARFSDRQDGLYQTELGGLLSFRAASGVELGVGYRRVGAHNGNTGSDEDRLRQQVVATFGPVTTRFRVDERFDPRGREVGFRVRPLIRYNHRLRDERLALFVSHESFILPNSTKWGQRAGYERMRNMVGLVVPLGREVTADVGYLNQYRLARAGTRAQIDHALSVQITVNIAALSSPQTHD